MACLFCSITSGDEAAHVVYDDEHTVTFLDNRPLFKGHVLVVPRRHVATLVDLPDELVAPFFATVRHCTDALPRALDAQGTFVAINNVVSQSVPHLHAHVVPRTKGDGLRGFFWPRTRYADALEAEQFAERLRDAL